MVTHSCQSTERYDLLLSLVLFPVPAWPVSLPVNANTCHCTLSNVYSYDLGPGSLLIDHHDGGAGRNAFGAVLAIIAIGYTRGTDGLVAVALCLERSAVEAGHGNSMSLALESLRRDSIMV